MAVTREAAPRTQHTVKASHFARSQPARARLPPAPPPSALLPLAVRCAPRSTAWRHGRTQRIQRRFVRGAELHHRSRWPGAEKAGGGFRGAPRFTEAVPGGGFLGVKTSRLLGGR